MFGCKKFKKNDLQLHQVSATAGLYIRIKLMCWYLHQKLDLYGDIHEQT